MLQINSFLLLHCRVSFSSLTFEQEQPTYLTDWNLTILGVGSSITTYKNNELILLYINKVYSNSTVLDRPLLANFSVHIRIPSPSGASKLDLPTNHSRGWKSSNLWYAWLNKHLSLLHRHKGWVDNNVPLQCVFSSIRSLSTRSTLSNSSSGETRPCAQVFRPHNRDSMAGGRPDI